MEWLVPGLLEEKCTAILKGLPKQMRKHFVPVPNYVKAFIDAAQFGEGDLYDVLSHQLLRMTGVKVPGEELQSTVLEDHLLMNIRLVDEKGKLIAESRSWSDLNERYSGEIVEGLSQNVESAWGRTGLTKWDFGPLEPVCKITKYAGMEMEAYPALVDKNDALDLCVKASASEAEHESKKGIVRLALLNMPEQIRFAKKQLSKDLLTQTVLLSNGLIEKHTLDQQIIWLACRELMQLDKELVRDGGRFESLLVDCKANLVERSQAILKTLHEIAKSLHVINKQLKGKVQLTDVPVLNDIKQQLSDLFHKDFMYDLNPDAFGAYPRYLQAIEIRLDKFRRNLRQECLLSEQLGVYVKQFKDRHAHNMKSGTYCDQLDKYRWLIEEYRVSVFAPTAWNFADDLR